MSLGAVDGAGLSGGPGRVGPSCRWPRDCTTGSLLAMGKTPIGRSLVVSLVLASNLVLAGPSGRRDRPRGLYRRHRRERDAEPNSHGVRARRPAVRRAAGRCPAGDQERVAARDAVPDRDRQLVRRARPAGRRLRSRLHDQPVRVRLLHGDDPGHPQPGQPVYRERRRRGAGERDCDPRAPQPLGHESQRRCDPLRARRQALRRRRRECRFVLLPNPGQSPREAAPDQPRRLDPDRQPVLRLGQRHQPVDLGDGPSESVHIRVPVEHGSVVHQRRRGGLVGRDQRRNRGLELRLAGL